MSADKAAVATAPSAPAKPGPSTPSNGLASDEAKSRLYKDGPNAMPDTSVHPLRNALAKFWAPVPWLLEAAIVLQVVLHKDLEAAVIAGVSSVKMCSIAQQSGRWKNTTCRMTTEKVSGCWSAAWSHFGFFAIAMDTRTHC